MKQWGRVNKVADVKQLPPGYVPTPEEEDEDQSFQRGLEFLRVLLEAQTKHNMDSIMNYIRKRPKE